MLDQHKEDHKFHFSWLQILISFTVWADPPDYVQMDVPLSFLGARYQNLWEDKAHNNHQKDNNIVFFMHIEVLREFFQHSHRIRATTVHRYVAFIKFQSDAHSINLLPTKDLLQQVHQASFMVTDDNVDAIVNLWQEKWSAALAKPLPQEHNVEELPIHQVNAEEHEGNDTQDNLSQEHINDDDDIDDSNQHPSE